MIYRVTAGRVEIHHEAKVAADNTAPMFFSIGNPLGLPVPLLAGSSAEAVAIASPSRFEYLRGKNGAPDGTTRERSFPLSTPLDHFQFMPAMSVGGYDSDPWLRLTDASGLWVKVTRHAQSAPVPPFVQFNLYGRTVEGVFCPEPFVGLHNSLNTQTGQIALAPGKSWSWLICVEPERAARPIAQAIAGRREGQGFPSAKLSRKCPCPDGQGAVDPGDSGRIYRTHRHQ